MGMPRVPAPDEDALHIHSHTAGSVGPISRKALATRLADGLVPPGAFVWVDGMPGWEPLDDHRAALVDALVDTVIAPPEPAQPAPAPAAAEPAPANGGGHARVAEVPTLVEAAPAAAPDERNPANEGPETAPTEPATPWTGAGGDAASAETPGTTADTATPAETATAAATEPAPEPATPAAEATAAATEPVSEGAPDAVADVSPAGAEAPNAAEPTRAEPQPAQSAPAEAEAEPADPDAVFGALVRDSWQYLERQRRAAHLDDVFVGAVITSTLDTGYALIDLESDGTHHYLRFEDLADRSRIVCRLAHLTPSVAVARVVGQRVSAVIGYGERVANIGKIWAAISAEMKSSYLQEAEPGTITVDGDAQSGYVYAQVDLFLDLDRYVAEDYAIDYARLSAHVGATTQALRKYLRGRFA